MPQTAQVRTVWGPEEDVPDSPPIEKQFGLFSWYWLYYFGLFCSRWLNSVCQSKPIPSVFIDIEAWPVGRPLRSLIGAFHCVKRFHCVVVLGAILKWGSNRAKSSWKCDVSRVQVTDWTGSNDAGWFMRATPAQVSGLGGAPNLRRLRADIKKCALRSWKKQKVITVIWIL